MVLLFLGIIRKGLAIYFAHGGGRGKENSCGGKGASFGGGGG